MPKNLPAPCVGLGTFEVTSRHQKKSYDHDMNPDVAVAIAQGCYGLIDAHHHRKIIGTFGAGPCTIVGAYKPSEKIAAIAHIDYFVKKSPVDSWIHKFFSALEGQDLNAPVHVYVRGGDEHEEIVGSINSHLAKQWCPNLEIVSAKTNNWLNPASLAIHAETGEIIEDFDAKKLFITKRGMEMITQSIMMPNARDIFLEYDGRQNSRIPNIKHEAYELKGSMPPLLNL